MAEAKHSFVDDYPYLVYSPNAETTFEGGSGGGTGLPVVEMDEITGKLNVTAGELVEMLKASPVFVNAMITIDSDAIQTWVMFVNYMTADTAYGFIGLTIADAGTGAITVIFQRIPLTIIQNMKQVKGQCYKLASVCYNEG